MNSPLCLIMTRSRSARRRSATRRYVRQILRLAGITMCLSLFSTTLSAQEQSVCSTSVAVQSVPEVTSGIVLFAMLGGFAIWWSLSKRRH